MSWTSPWDGGDRRVLRLGLAAIAVFDAIYMMAQTVVSSRLWVGGVALVAVWSLLRFGRGRQPAVFGVIGLAALSVLATVYANAHGGPYRANFASGAMLLGWVAGLSVARLARVQSATSLRLAEVGAVALLAATYVAAGTSKLLGAGMGFADADTLRAIILGHAPVDGEGIVGTLSRVVVAQPGLAAALAAATLVIQLGALVYPLGRRSRVVWGTALIAFHVGVALTTRIGYWQPVLLLMLFSYPWPRWLARVRRSPVPDQAQPDALRRAVLAASGVVLSGVAVAWLVPAPSAGDDSSPASRRSVAGFGPLAVGDPLDQDWTIESIDVEPNRARVVLVSAEHGRAVLWIEPRSPGARRNSPFDTGAARIYYGDTAATVRSFEGAARTLSRRIVAAAREPAEISRWLSEA